MSSRITKIIAVALLLAAACFSAGCSPGENGLLGLSKSASSDSKSQTAKLTLLKLPADLTDSFNPFKATTVSNRYIFPLMYDSLFKLDNSFKAKKYMALKFSNDGLSFRVALKEGLEFANGSPVTADDVTYSLLKAKSSPLYSAQLANIESIENDYKTIKINLKHYDCNFANCLEVPIVKSGTADSSSAPEGSGRYILYKKNGQHKLKYNKKHQSGKVPYFKNISLSMVPDADSIMTSVKTGQIHAMFSDLRNGEIGGAYTNTSPVSLNNMIYIGINSSRPVLREPEARRAVSYALNRSTILAKGYSSRGVSAYLPINPVFDAGKGEIKAPLYNIKKAVSLLEKLGYSSTNLHGIRIKNKKPLTMKLLINSDNTYKILTANAVKSALRSAGIAVETEKVKSLDALKGRIASGKFDLYLGETRLPANMDISVFFGSSPISKEIGSKSKLSASYKKYLKSGSVTEFSKTFFNETPFIPLLFRSGITAYNGNISVKPVCTPGDIYSNIYDWK